MKELLEAIPYARFLGVAIEPASEGFQCILPFRPELIGNTILPAIHGGVLGAFAELTALFGLIDETGIDRVPKPVSFTVDYLRTAGPRDTHARADIFKLGRRIANVHVVGWQDDPTKPVVAGNGKFLF
ncbi:MAG TPA: PaaI family thioesterase [Candidatus Acidoferrales bacterium]|nr:PaaI family thioesterase [Candidatus Acidoferrales bacterium]